MPSNKKQQPPLKPVEPQIKRKTPWYFYVILLLIPVIFFVLLEAGLRIFNYGKEIPQWVDGSKGKYIINPELAYRYFYSVENIPTTIEDVFDQVKKKNSFRVFVLGGSSAAGYPYMPMGSFSRYIRRRLELVYPNTNVEVVNIALTAVNSYTLRDLIPGVLEQKPNLIIFYAGHNEYYGALGVGSMESLGTSRTFINLMLYLNKFKTIQLIRNLIASSITLVSEEKSGEAAGTLMSKMAKDQYITYNSDKFNAGIEQFEGNMRDALQMIKEKNVPVIIGKLVSNLKDQHPFVSASTENYPSANKIFNEAKAAYTGGQYKKADSLFRLAKDLDVLRFRASEKMNRTIEKLCKEFNIPAVPFDSIFNAKSPGGIVGDNLMTDHLHPNLEGYEIMGQYFYEQMQKSGYLPKNDKPVIPFDRQDSLTRANFVFSDLDLLMGNNKIKLLKNDYPFIQKKYAKPVNALFPVSTMIDSIAFDALKGRLSWVNAHLEAADRYIRMNNVQEYMKHVDIVLYQYPIIVEYMDRAALVLMQLKDYNDALKYLEQRYRIEPNNFSTKWIGTIALYNGNYDRAIKYLSISHRTNPNDAQLLYNLAGAYSQKKDYQTALSVINDCLKIDPNYPMAANLKQQLMMAVRSMK
jgi:tetratricopeptide (TPR) repeat protein